MAERRANSSVREQAQKWFEALRTHLRDQAAQNDIADKLQRWPRPEDVMRENPRLLPPLLAMVWRLRAEPGLAELFQTSAGTLAQTTAEAIVPSGKTFDEIVLAHLHGAARLYLERQEREWLATERERHKPTGLAASPLMVPVYKLMRQFGWNPDEKLHANYPQRGLYPVLKPFLRHRRQFDLIEAYATLSTRSVNAMGPVVAGLQFDQAIRNLASLETAKCKFVTELARAFAEAVINHAARQAADGAPAVENSVSEIAGLALSHLAADGLHLAKGAISVRECARDVVTKMCLPMGYDAWRVFANKAAVQNIAECPPAVAYVLGPDAGLLHKKTSDALAALKDQRAAQVVAVTLRDRPGRDAFVAWAGNPDCAPVWTRLVKELNQQMGGADESVPLGEEQAQYVAGFCESLIPAFAAMAQNVQAKSAAPSGAPATGLSPSQGTEAVGAAVSLIN